MVVAASGACGLGSAFARGTAMLDFFRHGNYSFRSGINSGIIIQSGFAAEYLI
jgi:hypothetical protein